MDISQPRLIVALGLYRGASTWTYNVMSALVSGETTRSFFADNVGSIAAQLSNETTHAFIKSHCPDAGMRLLIKLGGLPVVLNVRDPLDCVASLMTQFGQRFDEASDYVVRSAVAILDTLRSCEPLLLRYEHDQRESATVLKIAEAIDVRLAPAEAETIAFGLRPERVRSLIRELEVDGVFAKGAPSLVWDPQTH